LTLVQSEREPVAIISQTPALLLEDHRSSLGTGIGIGSGIVGKILLAIRIAFILLCLFRMKRIVLEIIANVLIFQQGIVLFTTIAAITHHQLGIPPEQGVHPLKMGW
jgi:hypothetical protein